MRRALSLLLAVLSLSCGRSTLIVGMDHRLTEEHEHAVERRVGAWIAFTGWECFRFARRADADVFIVEEPPNAKKWGDHEDGLVRTEPGLSIPNFERVVGHELGHALGLKHTATGVMVPGDPSMDFTEDVRRECWRVGACE